MSETSVPAATTPTTINIKGTYSEKIEIFGIVISHHTGSFDFSKPLQNESWSQTYGPVTITAAYSAADDDITVTASAFSLSVTLFKQKVVVNQSFHLEVDRGNEVDGTVSIS
jgi:hypothetical protein